HRLGTGSAADWTAWVVELDSPVEIPALTVVARDHETPGIAARARPKDFRGNQQARADSRQIEAPAVLADLRKWRHRLPALAPIGGAQSGPAHQRSLRGADNRHESVL